MDLNYFTVSAPSSGWLAFFGPIIAASIALGGVWLTVSAALQNNRKNLLVGTITAERANWRQDLRAETALFVEAVHEALAKPSSERMVKVHRHRVGLRLRVNPNPKHQVDSDILKALDAIPTLITAKNKAGAISKLQALEADVQRLLKDEWDKSKREAETGVLEVKPVESKALVLDH